MKLAPVFFVRSEPVSLTSMQMGQPGKDRKFTLALIPGKYFFSIDASINHLTVQRVTLDDKPITNGKLHIDSSPEPRKLVIVLASKPTP